MSIILKELIKDAVKEENKNTTPIGMRQEMNALKKVKNPVINWYHTRKIAHFGATEWEQVEYEFAEIERISDIDSYLLQSFRKKLSLALKEGWAFVSPNTSYVQYIEKRLEQIAYATNISTYELIGAILFDLIRFSNSFVVKVRKEESSGGFPYTDTRTGKRLMPVAGLFVLPASTVEVRTDKKTKQVTKYRQYMDDDKLHWVEYNVEDVCHFHINKKQGFIVGTPRCVPVIEDIKALRRLEENVELLTMQSLFPLIHYKVGTEQNPAVRLPSGISEIEQVYNEIQNAPPEGIYVTSERHEIQMIGSEGRALRVESYLDYFKKRVLAGLSLSGVDIGDGDTANRSTADNMSRSLVDEIKGDQQAFEEQFRRMIINELLLESGQKIDLTALENQVHIKFEEIDYETKVKKENAVIQKWLQNLITVDEARIEMDYNIMTDEELQRTYLHLITIPGTKVSGAGPALAYSAASDPNIALEEQDIKKAQQAQEQMVAKTAKAKAAASPSKGTVSNRARPANQYGTKSSSAKSTKDSHIMSLDIFDYTVADLKSEIKRSEKEKNDNMYAVIPTFKDRISKEIEHYCRESYMQGLRDSGVLMYMLSDITTMTEVNKVRDNCRKYCDRFFQEIEDHYRSNRKNFTSLLDKIDSIGYRVSVIKDTESTRAYNWGYIKGLQLQNIQEFTYNMNNDTDINEKQYIAANNFLVHEASFNTIAPWHPNSTIKVVKVSNE
jgi:hypothetical protein